MKLLRRMNSLPVTFYIFVTVLVVIPLVVTSTLPVDKSLISSTLTKCLLDKESIHKTSKIPYYMSDPTLLSSEAASISSDCYDIIRSYMRDYYTINYGFKTSDTAAPRNSPIKTVPLFDPGLIKLGEESGKQDFHPFEDDGRLGRWQTLVNYPQGFINQEFSHRDPRKKFKVSDEESSLKPHQELKMNSGAGYMLENFVANFLNRLEHDAMVPSVSSQHMYMPPLESGTPIKRMLHNNLLKSISDMELAKIKQKAEQNRRNMMQGMLRDGR